MDKPFKNILLAVGSSQGSKVAMQKACDFASKFEAKLTAVFVGAVQKVDYEDSIAFLKSFSSSKGIKCTTMRLDGNVCSEVYRLQQEMSYDLIIITAKRSNCYQFFGLADKMTKLLKNSACPVLSIPPRGEDFSFSNMLLPITDSPLTRQKVPCAADIAKVFNGTIHVLGASKRGNVNAQERVHSYVRQTERYLVERGVKFTVLFRFGTRVPTAVQEYSQRVNAGIVFEVTNSEDGGGKIGSYKPSLLKKGETPVFSTNSTIKNSVESI